MELIRSSRFKSLCIILYYLTWSNQDICISRTVRINPPNAAFATGGARHARRPTGFVRKEDLQMFRDDDDDDDDDDDYDDDDDQDFRPSVLNRLYENLTLEDSGPGPTLKDYRPFAESRKNNSLFLTCPLRRIKSDDDEKEKYNIRRSISVDQFDKTIDQVLDLQHGKKVGRKISSDYVKTIDHIERRGANSIRSIEFAKTRPAISIVEYQKKNQQYHEEQLKKALDTKSAENKPKRSKSPKKDKSTQR